MMTDTDPIDTAMHMAIDNGRLDIIDQLLMDGFLWEGEAYINKHTSLETFKHLTETRNVSLKDLRYCVNMEILHYLNQKTIDINTLMRLSTDPYYDELVTKEIDILRRQRKDEIIDALWPDISEIWYKFRSRR